VIDEIDWLVETLELDVSEQGREAPSPSFVKVRVFRAWLASFMQCVCCFSAIIRAQGSAGVETHFLKSFADRGERWAMNIVASKFKFRLRERGGQLMNAT